MAIDGGDVGDRHSVATLQMPIRPPARILLLRSDASCDALPTQAFQPQLLLLFLPHLCRAAVRRLPQDGIRLQELAAAPPSRC